MAEKEATVYIVDVGSLMREKNHGRSQTDLEWAMAYIWDKITTIMALDRKTTLQAVIGLKTDGKSATSSLFKTNNELQEEESFEHISVFQELGRILMPDLFRLRTLLVPNQTNRGDAISALVLAIQMIAKTCKKLQYKKKILLVTNGRGEKLDMDQVDEITAKIVDENIELVVLGVDFDDPEYGYQEEGKPLDKGHNEELLRSLTEQSNGVFGTLAQAVDELGMPRLKATRPVASLKDMLKLGSPDQYDTAIQIEVERYPRVMIRPPPSASLFVPRSTSNDGPATAESSTTVLPDIDLEHRNDLTSVKNNRKYEVIDKSSSSGKREVEYDELAKGYEYGRTAVYISESDMSITTLETKAGLEIIGFIPQENFDRYMGMSTTHIIIGAKYNTKAIMALSSVIHALHELESFAVGRLVLKQNKAPLLVLLAPLIEPDYECLVDLQIPFAEDVRIYRFPPLDRVVTVSGKVIYEHRNLPNDTLKSAMSDYVDRMDLSTFGRDEEGEPTDYVQMTDTFSPILHRVDQAIRWRAANPTEPVPQPPEILTRYSKPPDELVNVSKRKLEKLIASADIKKVPPKARVRRQNRETVKPISGLDVDSMLKDPGQKRDRISADNPIPEFKQMLDRNRDPDGLKDAAAQFGAVIEKHVQESVGAAAYGRVMEELGVLRQELEELEEAGMWNEWLRDFKEKLFGEKLGGNRKELWWEIRTRRYGLVVKSRKNEESKVDEEEARKFLREEKRA